MGGGEGIFIPFRCVSSADILSATDIFAAGTDTTSITMSWIMPELVNHADVKKRLMDEIDEIVGRDAKPTHEHFAKMPFLDAIVEETLRRHTPVPLSVPLEALEPIELSTGHVIPVKSMVSVSIWACHQDPNYWENPLRWNPQRWIDNPDLRRSPSFMPFKNGNRTCIGRFLSIFETKVILVSFFQRFDVQHPQGDGYKIDLTEADDVVLNKPPAETRVKVVRRE